MLHMSKVAVGCATADALAARIAGRAEGGVVRVTTRYRPTRHAELIGGSLYWIVKHRLVGRQEILGFAESEDRRCLIELDARLVPVLTQPRRAHQGWRYLKAEEAPRDLPKGAKAQQEPPPKMAAELRALGLL